jgi:hypothetical protein
MRHAESQLGRASAHPQEKPSEVWLRASCSSQQLVQLEGLAGNLNRKSPLNEQIQRVRVRTLDAAMTTRLRYKSSALSQSSTASIITSRSNCCISRRICAVAHARSSSFCRSLTC